MNFLQPGESVIRKVQLAVPAGQDVLLARLRAESALQSAALHPTGLPPAAILVIRQVSGPRLGCLAAAPADYSATRRWAQAFDSRLENLAAQALRPLYQTVPAEALAVLFADRAELLACLARDWLDGRLAARWWWRSIFARMEFAGLIPSTFARFAADAPAAIETLARLGRAMEFARQLDEPSARLVLSALLPVFDLRLLALVFSAPDAPQSRDETQPRSAPPADSGSPASHQDVFQSEFGAPFAQLIPEACLPDLSPAAQDLLMVALLLRRAPALIRSAEFAARLTAWQAAGRLIRARQADEAATPGMVAPAVGRESAPVSQAEMAVQPLRQDEPGLQLQPPASLEAYVSPVALACVTRTDFGGLFYLLNLAVYLEIYADFTRPASPGWDLSPWDLLALLGRHWLGEAFEADPLWALLAELAGRDPQDAPGADFAPPSGWESSFLQAGLPLGAPEWPWLERLAAALRARLTLALGFDNLPRFLGQPARALHTAARLDVYFALAGHPLEVRLAGLDRDLGWLPAAGYAIYYHFE